MSPTDKPTRPRKKKAPVRKPPPRWRKYLVQAELELPSPSADGAMPVATQTTDPDDDDDEDAEDDDAPGLPWWQSRAAVLGLAAACLLLLVVAGVALRNGARDRAIAVEADARVRTLTLRAVNAERAVRITPNPRSWSAAADATLAWPDPPQLLELYLSVGYTSYLTFALVIDKVDHGRVMVIERMSPDSNRDLRLSLNSSAFGPGEYRIRVQGYSWRGERVDVGWVRLAVREGDRG
jgi:hypothetical protein